MEIDDQNENDVLKKFLADTSGTILTSFWLGATASAKEGEWIWQHSGKKMPYNNWYPGRPWTIRETAIAKQPDNYLLNEDGAIAGYNILPGVPDFSWFDTKLSKIGKSLALCEGMF